MDIFNEILWSQFKELNHVRKLSLNEQVNQYNQYLNDLQYQRQCYIQQLNWLKCSGGGIKKETLQNIDVLLQEDLFDLEQEDRSKILII